MTDAVRSAGDREPAAHELGDLRAAFDHIARPKQRLQLEDVLSLPEVKAQVAEDDVSVEDLEGAWLEACVTEAEDKAGAMCEAGAPKEQNGMSSISTGVSFEGFVRFLELCESRVPLLRDLKEPGLDTLCGRNLVAARRGMLGMLRATLVLHGGAGTMSTKGGVEGDVTDEDESLGAKLHSAMVRAILEEGWAQHTPETLEALVQRGVLKASYEEFKRERAAREALLDAHLSKHVSQKQLIDSGILVDMTPEELELERQAASKRLREGLESRHSLEELIQRGLLTELSSHGKRVEKAFLTSKLKHDLVHRTDVSQLRQKGIVLDMGPDQAHEEQHRAAEQVKLCLETRPALDDVRASKILRSPDEEGSQLDVAKGTLESMLSRGTSGDDVQSRDEGFHGPRRPTLDELKARGIYLTLEQVGEITQRLEVTKNVLEHELAARATLSELEARGIYRSQGAIARQRLERALLSDLLERSFKARPHAEELMDRGVLEASILEDAFEELSNEGPLDSARKLLRWRVLASAVEEGVVNMASVENAFGRVMGAGDAHKETAQDGGSKGMTYEQFSSFLSELKTTQVEGGPMSLKLWALMKMRPAADEKEHHESTGRRNALMATELEHGLSRREPLEQLANKGIFLDRTPLATGVERAHLKHTLANGLKHRSTLDELAHKGVYLEGVLAGDLEQAHRDARNTLEGMLSLRPDVHDLEEKGYLEADEVEEAFLELVLKYKREGESGAPDGSGKINSLELPAGRLAAWAPVRALVESGVAMEDDVVAALKKAQEAMPGAGTGGGTSGGIDFVGFLEFVHNLDLEVDGLDHDGSGRSLDAEATERHRRRLEMRRARAAKASSDGAEMTHETLKESLMAHLRSRPSRSDPETLRIAKEFRRIESVELEKELVRNRIESHLRSRLEHSEKSAGDRSQEGARGLVTGGERAARVKDLEFMLNRRMLMHRLAKRPPEESLLHKGILHSQSPPQERLQRMLASNLLKHALEARPTLDEVKQAGIYRGDGDAIRASHEAAAEKLANGLRNRPSLQEVEARGIVGPSPGDVSEKRHLAGHRPRGLPPQTDGNGDESRSAESSVLTIVDLKERLDMKSKKEILEGGLDHRPSLEELKNRGLYQDTTPSLHEVDRAKVEESLESFLGNSRRPTKKDLRDQGIYVTATPQQFRMEHCLAARNVKHGLEGRESVQDLKDHGIYLPEDSKRARHNKLLVKALLRRRLSHAFSAEELAQLKQKGIYKEEEHERLRAERMLVTQQLSHLMSNRPNPGQLEQDHPEILEASTLALVFEERVRPRATGEDETDGGPEHLVSLEALMTWPDVQEFVERAGKKDAKLDMMRYFRLCDTDGDGFLTFSQFLRWVELCDLNPEDCIQVSDQDLDAEYAKLIGVEKNGVSFGQAINGRLVQRWATSGGLDRETLKAVWEEGESAGGKKGADAFKAFCRVCESRSSAGHQLRQERLHTEASQEDAAAKKRLKSKLSAKLSARPDLEELKKARIYRAGGLEPATELLERDLIASDLRQQLLARPAIEELERRGIKPRADFQVEKQGEVLSAALDTTLQHDDARWRSDPSRLGAGSKAEVSALLQRNLAKRSPLQELSNKGIYLENSSASYSLLVHKILQTHVAFKASAAQLLASLKK